MPYVLKNTFLPSYWEGLGGKWLSKIMQVLELRRPLDKKGEKREKIKRRRRRFLNVVCNQLKTFFEVVLNFTMLLAFHLAIWYLTNICLNIM